MHSRFGVVVVLALALAWSADAQQKSTGR